MLWVGRLFEERYTFVRITILALSGVGYLTFAPDGSSIRSVELAFAIGAILFGYAGLYSPIFVVCGLAIAAAISPLAGVDNEVVPEVAMAWSMFELGMRRSGWPVWTAFAVGIGGEFLSDLLGEPDRLLPILFGCVVTVGAPFLLGLHISAMRLLATQASTRTRQEMTQVRAEERTTIARELHDLVAHHVASIVLRVAVARNVLPLTDPRVQEVLDDVHATGSSALADLRRLVTVLRDPRTAQETPFVDPSGLPVALGSAVERSRQIGLTVSADIDPAVVELDSRTALAVLRLTQEGLANVAKHAGTAAKAQLSIVVKPEQVEFELRDSGGLPASPVRPDNRHGLIGLRERVEVLDGKLDAGPLGSGWCVSAVIPR